MEVVPESVGRASRRWDDEHLDLQAAADGIGAAPTGGFTAAVAGTARRFGTAWSGFTHDVGEECEHRADALRRAVADYLATDQATGAELTALAPYLGERR